MDATVDELRRDIETRDAFLARASTTLLEVVEQVASGTSTIDELRAFARELAIIAGNEEARIPRRTELDAATHVARIVERWKMKTGGRVSIAFEAANGIDAKGSWDPDLLDTILGELVSNACKYGGGRPVVVRVEADDARVRIVVDDEGTGVDAPNAAERALLFRRGTSGQLANVPGFGVGLWLTHRLAGAHGGTFGLARRAEGGTRAVVELPRCEK